MEVKWKYHIRVGHIPVTQTRPAVTEQLHVLQKHVNALFSVLTSSLLELIVCKFKLLNHASEMLIGRQLLQNEGKLY